MTDDLRRLAEAALNEPTEEVKYRLDEFYAAASPDVVLALLDDNDRLRAALQLMLDADPLNVDDPSSEWAWNELVDYLQGDWNRAREQARAALTPGAAATGAEGVEQK